MLRLNTHIWARASSLLYAARISIALRKGCAIYRAARLWRAALYMVNWLVFPDQLHFSRGELMATDTKPLPA